MSPLSNKYILSHTVHKSIPSVPVKLSQTHSAKTI